jgi:uncharacterized protein YkwD
MKIMQKIAKTLGVFVIITVCVVITLTAFIVGYVRGYGFGKNDTEVVFQKLLADKVSSTTSTTKPVSSANPTGKPAAQPVKITWGGLQLWDAVNKRRTELGVNPLSTKEEVCTIASIRLNQLLELGKLDGHVGFSNLPEARPDLKWIFEKYNLSEFLVSGATSAQEAVSLWENTLGHKELLTGGQYVWGCTYAQAGFGVAIAAY